MVEKSHYYRTDYKGWAFSKAQLEGLRPAVRHWDWDAAFPSPDNRYAVLLYSISEVNFMVMAARFLLAENPEAPNILISNLPLPLDWYFDAPEPWLSNTICLARVTVRYYRFSVWHHCLVLLDAAARKFGFLEEPACSNFTLSLDGDCLRSIRTQAGSDGDISVPPDQSLAALTWHPFEDIHKSRGLEPSYERWCRLIGRRESGRPTYRTSTTVSKENPPQN